MDNEMTFESELLLSVWKALGLKPASRPGPCWCNGPYQKESEHFEWCRENRKKWKKAIAQLKKSTAIDPCHTK